MDGTEVELIAPCGMNCRLCMAYQREKRRCKGCHGYDASKMPSCLRCIIRNCPTITSNESGFCYECEKYPCKRLKQLDKRYRTKYHMSMLENLESIKNSGMAAFLQEQKERWTCPTCKDYLSVHRDACLTCGNLHISP
ncbi:MAG: DUF3795 domain-containing protein [Actinobacteria bacterium]|nr:DUF3795 domain-containing protein [Actinomycetota bacterium]